MATFDPTVGGIQVGGGPSLGGAPDVLSPFAAGAAMGHLVASFEAKRDANGHNRGTLAAHEIITRAEPDLLNHKTRHLTEPDFNSTYMTVMGTAFETQREKLGYTPQSEAEQIAFENTLATYRQSEFQRSFIASAKAVHEQDLGILQKNVETFKDAYVSAGMDSEANLHAGNLFLAYQEASRMDKASPGVITPQQAAMRFETDIRTAAISRIMAHTPVDELFAFGHDSSATVMIPAVEAKHFTDRQFPPTVKAVPLSLAEREGLVKYALQKQANEFHLIDHTHKIAAEKVKIQKTVAERTFYDSVIASGGVTGPSALQSLQVMSRDDGAPLFDGGDIGRFQTFIHTQMEQSKKPPVNSDPAVYRMYYNQIYPKNKDGGLDYSNFPLPDPGMIMADSRLRLEDRTSLIHSVTAVAQMRTNRDFSDFAKRTSMGEELLETALGGKAFIEMSEDTKNFHGLLLNQFNARIQQRYNEALAAGNGLKAIDPAAIVNQLIEEQSPAMDKIFFRSVERQSKVLSMYVNRIPKSVPDDAPVSVLLEEVLKDMNDKDYAPNRKGPLPTNEGVRLMQLIRTLQNDNKTVGELRQVLNEDMITFDKDQKKPVAKSWFYKLFQNNGDKDKR